MRLSARQYAYALVDFLQKNPANGETAAAFLETLRKNRQERLLSRILMIAEEVWREKTGELKVVATVAQSLSEGEISLLQKTLESSLKKKIDFTQKVDPQVKGGIALRLGDYLYDATLAGRLNALKRELTG